MVLTPIGSFHLRICCHLRVLIAPCSCANWAPSIWGRQFRVERLGLDVNRELGGMNPAAHRGTVKSSSQPRLAPVAEDLERAGRGVSPKYWLFLGAESLVSQKPLACSPHSKF